MNNGPYNPDTYRRRTIRLSNHDYSWTAPYFITIRAGKHESAFDTSESIFDIPEVHNILEKTWHDLPQRFPGVSLDEFVIMPDHIHFILWLDGTRENAPTLGQVVGAYKSITSVTWFKYLKAHDMSWSGHVWQRNYFERVIRDTAELAQKRQYILDNPTRLKQKEAGRPQRDRQ